MCHALVAGPDGNLWFTRLNAGKIGKVTSPGTVSEYILTDGTHRLRSPEGITVGSDGNLRVTAGIGTSGSSKKHLFSANL